MYSKDKINIALQVYDQCGSVTETIRVLGYPMPSSLYTGIGHVGKQKSPRKELVNINTAQHPRNPPIEVKMNALHRCFQLGESIKLVSEEIGYTRASIYAWRKKYLRGGTAALINDKNISLDTLEDGVPIPVTELEQLQAQMQDMQLEIDILKETINVLKRPRHRPDRPEKQGEGSDLRCLERHSLSLLLERLSLSKSSYYYQEAVLRRGDKYRDIRKKSRNCSMKPRGIMDIEGYTGYWNVKEFTSQKK